MNSSRACVRNASTSFMSMFDVSMSGESRGRDVAGAGVARLRARGAEVGAAYALVVSASAARRTHIDRARPRMVIGSRQSRVEPSCGEKRRLKSPFFLTRHVSVIYFHVSVIYFTFLHRLSRTDGAHGSGGGRGRICGRFRAATGGVLSRGADDGGAFRDQRRRILVLVAL